jgi:hypothetical protein
MILEPESPIRVSRSDYGYGTKRAARASDQDRSATCFIDVRVGDHLIVMGHRPPASG